MSTFVETNCTFKLEGHTFELRGAYLVDCTDGYRRGFVYAKQLDSSGYRGKGRGAVTTWNGDLIAEAQFGPVYRNNLNGCKMQSVAFSKDGIRYVGRYCPDWAQAVRVRSTKKVCQTVS